MRARPFAIVAAVAVLLGAMPLVARAEALDPPAEFRAYWVDAFGEGLFSPTEVDRLVAAAKAANMNAIVAQIGRRGDCFCNNAAMPRTQANIAPYPYDPLKTLIDKAHAEGIEVHAWIITTAIWNSAIPPRDPGHVFNTHGPSKTGYDNWIMTRYDGLNRSGADYLLDPGHPDAAEYIVRMYTSVIENYDVDGINFDRVRYPDGQLAAWPNDSAWGYNPVALARFHAATGRSDKPLPNDRQWQQWRRDQITSIVRRVYIESFALKPHVRVSADTITYEYGPHNPMWGSWENARPYREVLQDWRAWMEEGILDLNIPMNYKREHCTATGPGCFGNQRLMYEEWNDYAKDHQYRRQTVIGSAIYLNTISGSVTQVRKALAPSTNGNSGVGWVGYSYRTPDCRTNGTCTPSRSGAASRAELTRALTQPSEYDTVLPPVFASKATVPVMTWKTQPTRGHIRGTVATAGGTPFDQMRIELYDSETEAFVAAQVSTAFGWFAFVDLVPGKYKAFVADRDRATGHRIQHVTVTAGQLADVTLTPFAKGQEGRRPVKDEATFSPEAEGEPEEYVPAE